MACFIVSAAEAAVVTVVKKTEEKKETNINDEEKVNGTIPLSKKLGWLSNMLWGGSALLAFEHVWHGEVVTWFPFLTAMADKKETIEMLKEMGTVGVSMAVLVTVVWAIICAGAEHLEKSGRNEVSEIDTVD